MNPILPINKMIEELVEQIDMLHEDNVSIPVNQHLKLIDLRKDLVKYLENE